MTETLFVGRERELSRISAALGAVLERDTAPRVVLVSAEAGTGKTALVQAFAARALGEHPGLVVATGTCDAYTGVSDPYLPFREILARLTGAGDAQPAHPAHPQGQRERHGFQNYAVEAIAEIGPELVGLLALGVPGLGLVLGAGRAVAKKAGWFERLGSKKHKHPPNPDAPIDQERIFEQFTALLVRLAVEAPLVLFLDDLHWADAASVGLLFHLARHLDGSPVLIVGAYRPDEVAVGRAGERHPFDKVLSELKRLHGDIAIDLDRASRADGRPFVDAVVDSEPNALDDEFRRQLFAHTGGHALFTLELLRHLQDRGDLVRSGDGRWIVGPALDWKCLPARIEGVIDERINRLDPGVHQLLQVASVEGADFIAQLVARVEDLPERQVLRDLAQEGVRRHRLVREAEDFEVGERTLSRFEFSHVLFQQYLYSELGTGERRLLHGEIAQVLEDFYGEQRGTIALKLARHHREAGRAAEAVRYLLLAGDQARLLYAHAEAIDAYRQALELLTGPDDDERAARTLMRLGLTYHSALDFDAARDAYHEGFERWQRAGDTRDVDAPEAAPHPLRLEWSEPHVLDPTLSIDIWSGGVIDQLFCGLVELSPDMEVLPDAAASWEITGGGRRYVFHLRPDRLWSDGTPVTAFDFEYAWLQVLRPGASQVGSLLYDIAGAQAFHQGRAGREAVGVRALDAHTLAVELEQPTAYFLHLLAFTVARAVPAHRAKNDDSWADPTRIVSCGPFRLETWDKGRSLKLRRDPHYRGRRRGNIEMVELVLEPDHALVTEAYQSHGLDVLSLRRLDRPGRSRARHRHTNDYLSIPALVTQFAGFDATRAPFNDARVRQAFGYAIDKGRLANVILGGDASPATGGIVPHAMPGHSRGIALPFDPERARALLAEAGYPGGTGFPSIEALSLTGAEIAAEFLSAGWHANLGIDVSWKPTDFVRALAANPHAFVCSWAVDYPDPDNFLRLYLNRFMDNDPDHPYRRLIESARATTDTRTRIDLYMAADRLLIEEAFCLPLVYERLHFLVRPWVRHFPTSPQCWWFWKDVVLEPHEDSHHKQQEGQP